MWNIKELIRSTLEDGDYTDQERQRELDSWLHDRLEAHEYEDCKEFVRAGAKLADPFCSSYYSDVWQMKFLVENNVVDVNQKNKNGKTYYSYAECGYDVTHHRRYKQVMDYLESKGAEKIVFSDKDKAFLKEEYNNDCRMIESVKKGEISAEEVEHYDLRKAMFEIGSIKFGVLTERTTPKDKDLTK